MNKRAEIVQHIVEAWEKDEAVYAQLGDVVFEFLEEEVYSLEVLPAIHKRVKSLISLIKTAIKKGKRYEDINDKLGLRIVVHLKSELDRVKKFVENSFTVVHYERKADILKFDQLGYASDHYEVKINLSVTHFAPYVHLSHLMFEIQVRTLCQHVWADIEHSLIYKQDIELEDVQKRRVFRLTSLLEICDDEFESIHRILLELPEYPIIRLLKTLEGKFFKYAKKDYDKEVSIGTLAVLSKSLKGQPVLDMLNGLKEFFEKNDGRIRQIFLERHKLLKTNVFLSQPEVFFIWYLVDNRQYDLIEVWKENFDFEDLREISIWWGNPVNE